jgi:hypothetical protein
LITNRLNMKSTQYHKALIIVYSAILALLSFLILITAPHLLSIVFGVVLILFLTLALSYYKLTVSVNEDYLAFSFGIGLIKKKYKLSNIKNCIPIKGKFSIYSRISFEKLPNGGKAYVLSSALSSIEITYTNENSIICSDRVGTDKPTDIADYINKRIAKIDVNLTV